MILLTAVVGCAYILAFQRNRAHAFAAIMACEPALSWDVVSRYWRRLLPTTSATPAVTCW